MKLPSILLALLLTASAQLAAQDVPAGRATFQISIHLPDSLKSPIPISGNVSVQMDVMTDGRRVAMEIVPDVSTTMAAGMHVKMLFTLGEDTAHVAILLPPEMAASMGGMAGMRMDLPSSMMGNGNPMLAGLMDSVSRTMTDSMGRALPVYRNLQTTSVVAGIRCEEWEAVIRFDTTRTCVIPAPAALLALQERFKAVTGMSALMAQIPGMAELEKSAFGGRKMVPLRTVNRKSGLRLELTGFTAGAPNPDVFELPANLQVMPMPGKPAIDH